MSSSLEKGFAKPKILFGYREIEQRQKSRFFPYRGRGAGYGAWHAFNEVTVTLFIEVAKETVAKIVLPTDSIYHVYRRRVPGGIAMAESTIIAVHRKAQLLWRNLNISQPERLGQLGGYGEGDFSLRQEDTYCRSTADALRVIV